MSGGQDDSFFARWSRRKAQARGAEATVPEPAGDVPARDPAAPAAAVATNAAVPPAAAAEPASPASPGASVVPEGGHADATVAGESSAARAADPAPTLADAEALTSESDFTRFVKRDVDEKVRNVALKRLFADPRFNVMDGLDTYIDDYNKPDPLPRSMLRQLLQARTLGLLDDELEEQPASARHPGVEAADGEAAAATPDAGADAEAAAGEVDTAARVEGDASAADGTPEAEAPAADPPHAARSSTDVTPGGSTPS